MLSVSFALLAFGFRMLFLQTVTHTRSKLLVLGASPLRNEIEKHLQKHPYLGYEIAEWIEEPTLEKIRTLREKLVTDESMLLVVAPNITKDPIFAAEMYTFLAENITITELLSIYADLFSKLPLELLDAHWFVKHIVPRRPFYDNTKRVIDIVIGFFLTLLLSPLAVLISILLRMTSRDSVFYIRERVGKNGKPFKLFKFRTMRAATEKTGPLWTEKNDTRITKIGKFLRHTHLDEIPQLINVLKGDISFTGPRPERVELAEQYHAFTHYEMRHLVKPGITGWAQINFRPSASFEEAYEKLKFDLFYVQNRSFFLDTLIMIRTLKHFFVSYEHTHTN